MTAYYNEHDPYCAQWLKNLVAAGHIPPGDVDDRNIADIQPIDLLGYTQVHLFAGIAGWGLACRLAGWPDSRPLWTASCPCQPFSVAGKGLGAGDPRHLWPHVFRLASALRPAVLMGEQVAAAVGKHWFDGVCADLESIGYAVGACVVPACAVDAPHGRDRLYFVADANSAGVRDEPRRGRGTHGAGARIDCDVVQGALAHSAQQQQQHGGGDAGSRWRNEHSDGGSNVAYANVFGSGEGRQQRSWEQRRAGGDTRNRHVAGSDSARLAQWQSVFGDDEPQRAAAERNGVLAHADSQGQSGLPFNGEMAGRDSGRWGGSEWITGADGKARRVKPGVRLLAHGVPARVAKLRAGGNAIVPPLAAEVIAAYMDCAP